MWGSDQSSGSRWAMRWPRTRYRLIRLSTSICFWAWTRGAVGEVVDVAVLAHRLVGHAHGLEHPLVKGVLPGEQPVHALEEQPDSAPWMIRWS